MNEAANTGAIKLVFPILKINIRWKMGILWVRQKYLKRACTDRQKKLRRIGRFCYKRIAPCRCEIGVECDRVVRIVCVPFMCVCVRAFVCVLGQSVLRVIIWKMLKAFDPCNFE